MSTTDSLKPNRELQEPSGTITPHILLVILQLLALSSPKFPGRRMISTLSITGLAILSQLNSPFTQELSAAQPWSLMWPHYLSTLEKILFSGPKGPESTFWHINQPIGEASDFPAFSFAKVKWAAAIIVNLRGIGWNYQVKNIPKQSRFSKRSFLMWQCVDFVRLLLITDVLLQLSTHMFLTSAEGEIGAMNTKYATVRHKDLHWGFIKALVFGAGPYFFISLQYVACSIIAVSLGFGEAKVSKPQECVIAAIHKANMFEGLAAIFWTSP